MLVRRIGFIAVSRVMGLVSELRVGCTAVFSVYQSVLVTVTLQSEEITNKMQPCNRIYYSKIY